MPLISKIYVWSLVFESLLFFQIGNQAITGVNLNLGRLLQLFILLIGFKKFFELLLGKKIRLHNPIYKNIIFFISIAIIGGMYGVIFGAYAVPEQLRAPDTSVLGWIANSPSVRPLLEYFIYFYYFVYFTFLPRYFLRNNQELKYFFKVFVAIFVISFAVGWGDIVLQMMGTGLYLPREIFSGYDIGMRFHGFSGEPRDAVVYLCFGLAILHLRGQLTDQKLTKFWIGGIIAAVLMTQSASGMLGILFFMALYGARFFFVSFTFRKLILAVLWGAAIVLILYVVALESPRVMLYVEVLASTYEILEAGATIPPLLAAQANNIFPIYQFVVNVLEFNWLPVLVGSGLGSSSSANLNIGDKFGLDIWGTDVTNPNSQLVRLVFETGIIGTVLFYRAFVKPVEHLARPLGKSRVNEFVLLMLLVLGCSFAHRSSAIFIYLGIFIAAMTVSAARRPVAVERIRVSSAPMAPSSVRA